MRNVHLFIQYGCDNRYKLVCDTIKVCHPFFKSCNIINTGPKNFTEGFQQDFPFIKIVNIPYFYGDLEPAKRAMISMTPQGEWLFYLDSDETPSGPFLENFPLMLWEMETKGFNCCRNPWFEHSVSDDGVVHMNCHGVVSTDYSKVATFPQTWEEAQKAGGFYCRRLLLNDGTLSINTNFGMHEDIEMAIIKQTYFPYPVIHKKSLIQCRQSFIFSSYSMPGVHTRPEEQHALLLSDEMKRFNEFKRKTKVFTSNDLVLKLMDIHDLEFREAYKEMAYSYKNSNLFPFKHFPEFADVEMKLHTPEHYCGLPCCKYENVQL